MDKKKIIEVNTIITSFYSRKGFITPNDYTLTLLLLCIYKDEAIDKNRRISEIVHQLKQVDEYNNPSELFKLLPNFRVLSFFTSDDLIQIFTYFSLLEKSYFENQFSELFDFIFKVITESLSFKNGAFIVHPKLMKLVFDIAMVKNVQRVYNPFASNAEIVTELKDNTEYFGQEYNPEIWRVGKLRLWAHQKIGFNYVLESSIENWPSEERFDLIFSRLPILNRIDVKDTFGDRIDLENFIIQQSLSTVKIGGKIILFVRPAFLSSGRKADKELFRKLVDENLVEKVLIFPTGVFRHTNVATNVLVLNTAKLSSKIEFIDIDNYLSKYRNRKLYIDWDSFELDNFLFQPWESVFVDAEDIRKSDYNLQGKVYFLEELHGTPLHELVEVSKRRKPENLSDISKVLTVRDLGKDSKILPSINYDLLEPISTLENLMYYNVLDEEGILVSLIGGTLNATYFSGKHAVLSHQRIALLKIIDEDVISYKYLVSELNKDYVQKQVEAQVFGSVVRDLRINDLLKIKINLVSSELQTEKIEEQLSYAIKELQDEIQKVDKDFQIKDAEKNAILRHKIAGSVSNLEFFATNIQHILDRKVLPEFPQLFSLKLNDNQLLNLGELIENLVKDSRRITEEVRSQTEDFVASEYTVSSIEIVPFLENYFKNVGEKNPNILFDINLNDIKSDDFKVFIIGNEDLFCILLDNLISNIKKHGFNWGKDEVRRIEVSGSMDKEFGTTTIFISNTGNPLPANFTFEDFKSKGIKKGKKGGSGMGGYIIDQIIKYFGGDWYIVDETGPEGLDDTDLATTFEISLPYQQEFVNLDDLQIDDEEI
ncbi:N-6 DNA methylase [Chryseobacterium koreense]|uniref:site-specific DNA-methyltransferase (adenine-specific) n=1 Tax=Chryseobacterium koreense CCUG 49689 TaxID=1304281 RepID=A0A0J7IYA5_9FLAO|nr:N-6 DNA methylase [Chryseobacterium koreense]KMQ70816.1 hypothetical protein ACM44_09260 [Chryseobacterium koreense CCUG 49689]MBB5332546.1 type I restriction enzyme M protein [Chryseobacterium koreense]